MSEFAPRCRLTGEEAVRYRAAANALGAPLAGDEFEVDRAGVCPELLTAIARAAPPIPRGAAVWILAGETQRDALYTSERFSFESELLERLFVDGWPLLSALIRQEALACIVTVAPAAATTLEDLPAMESALVELRSASGAVGRMARLSELDRGLERPDNYLSRDYVQSMVDLVAELAELLPGFSDNRLPNLAIEADSFCAPALGSVYLIRGEPQDLLIHPPPYKNPDLEESYRGLATPVKLSHPNLTERLRDMGHLRYDLSLLSRRMEEIENEVLLASGIDPLQLAPGERGPALAAHRPSFPRTWHELTGLQALVRRHPASAEAQVVKLSAEAKVKLAQPSDGAGVVNRLLSDLDPIDYVRLHRYNRVRFASRYADFPDLKKSYVRQLVRGGEAAPRPASGNSPAAPLADSDGITFF